MADYQQVRDASGGIGTFVLRRADGAFIPDDGGNRDRAAYDEWVAAGNQPDPPDPLPPAAPPPPDLNDLAARVAALESAMAKIGSVA